jgi:hypothetical protein
MRLCPQCGEVKPMTSCQKFCSHPCYGLSKQIPEKIRLERSLDRQRGYRAQNRESVNANQRRYRIDRKATGLRFPSQDKPTKDCPSRVRIRVESKGRAQRRRAWFSSDEYKSLQRERERQRNKLAVRRYRATHLDEVRERAKQWAMADRNRNPEKHREYQRHYFLKEAKWRARPEIKARIKAYKRLYKTVEFQVDLLLRQAAQLETALTERANP